MDDSNGTDRNKPPLLKQGLVATCDQCGAPMALVMASPQAVPVMVCNLCRVYYPLADVLMNLRRAERRLRRRPSRLMTHLPSSDCGCPACREGFCS